MMMKFTLSKRSGTLMTMTDIEQLTPEEYSEFLIDGELDEPEELLVFDDCEQMIGIPYEAN